MRSLHILTASSPNAAVYNRPGKWRILPRSLIDRYNIHMTGEEHRPLFLRIRPLNAQQQRLADCDPLRTSKQVQKLLRQIFLIAPDLIERLIAFSAHRRYLYHYGEPFCRSFKHDFLLFCQPFSPLTAIPSTKNRCAKQYSTSSGSMEINAPASAGPVSLTPSPTNMASPAESVRIFVEFVIIIG